MKKITTLFLALICVGMFTKAQTTAMQLSGLDCNGVSHNLYADLDAGKAVILHFFMSSCGSCPPPAQKIQAMANRILAAHPGKITAYAMPYENTTSCSYTSSWVSSNSLGLYAPFDSGATQVSHYGGFGMPTIVLLGGLDHKVLFSTLSFSTSDTTVMRDKILALLATGVADAGGRMKALTLSPNPATSKLSLRMDLDRPSHVFIDITDITGKQVAVLLNEKKSGTLQQDFDIEGLPNGIYFVRVQADGKTSTQKLSIVD